MEEIIIKRHKPTQKMQKYPVFFFFLIFLLSISCNTGFIFHKKIKIDKTSPQIHILGESYIYSYNGSEQNLVEFEITDAEGIAIISIDGKEAQMGGVLKRHLSVPALPGKNIKIWAQDIYKARNKTVIYKVKGSEYYHKKYFGKK